jgi:hypothetical protein
VARWQGGRVARLWKGSGKALERLWKGSGKAKNVVKLHKYLNLSMLQNFTLFCAFKLPI